MASVVFYFQVHQPFRLRRYTIFDSDTGYFDDIRNARICRKVAEKCYLPANRVMGELIDRHEGRFRISYSLTGVVIEQFQRWCPEVLDSFRALADTGCVEFIAETYHHSLAFLYDRDEFVAQTRLHQRLMEEIFGQAPKIFRNTELTYNNDVARVVEQMGYSAILTEGADHILGYRSPDFVYNPPNCADLRILLKNYRLSDDIAFRFANRDWPEWPLTAEKFAGWVDQINGNGYVCNLFMDYETFGEHQWDDTGIFEFIKHLPEQVRRHNFLSFAWPSEINATLNYEPEALSVPEPISWADTERDLSAWLSNSLQSNAMRTLYEVLRVIKESGREDLLATARKLSTSDLYYYMCTKYFQDGDVHKYFSPYSFPEDGYIYFMNALADLEKRQEEET